MNDYRLVKEKDYENIRALWDVTFKEDSDSWRDWYFDNIYRPQNATLYYKENTLVSMSHFNPYQMMLNGKIIKVSALAGIATRSDMRYKGYAGKLIIESLKIMKERGDAFSFLYPFSYDFYRKYGYELCYKKDFYIAKGSPEKDIIARETDIESFSKQAESLYRKFARDLNGYIIRDKEYFAIKLKEHFADGNKAFLIENKGKAIGYAFAIDNVDDVELTELICTEELEAAKAVSEIYNKSVKFFYPFNLSEKPVETKSHCMGRIIDVVGVFGGTEAKKGEMVIEIYDDIIDDNNGKFLFKSNGQKLHVEKTELNPQVSIGIKELSAVALGFEDSQSDDGKLISNFFFSDRVPWIIEVC